MPRASCGISLIELFHKSVELGVLQQDVGARRYGWLLLSGEMHPFVTAVLLRVAVQDAPMEMP